MLKSNAIQLSVQLMFQTMANGLHGEVKMELAETEARAESNMMRAAQLVEELRTEQGNSSRAEAEKREVEVGEDEWLKNKKKLHLIDVLTRSRSGCYSSMWKRERQKQSSGEKKW